MNRSDLLDEVGQPGAVRAVPPHHFGQLPLEILRVDYWSAPRLADTVLSSLPLSARPRPLPCQPTVPATPPGAALAEEIPQDRGEQEDRQQHGGQVVVRGRVRVGTYSILLVFPPHRFYGNCSLNIETALHTLQYTLCPY